VFVPLIRAKITKTQERLKGAEPVSVGSWRPFQVTHSARHPAETANKTSFNLVPCNRDLEVALAHFTDHATDVAAFCKNAGPQCLRIDFLAAGGRLAFYTPDFLIRRQDGNYLLAETKGREDRDVPAKARAAAAWCTSASTPSVKWEYLYVPQVIFDRFDGKTIEELVRACAPAAKSLLSEEVAQPLLPFEQEEEAAPPAGMDEFIAAAALAKLPKNTATLVNQAVQLFRFYEHKTELTFSPVFTPLLGPIDKCAQDLVFDRLVDDIPKKEMDQQVYFSPSMKLGAKRAGYLSDNARRIQKLLIYNAAIMPIGVLKFCLEYAESSVDGIGGLFASVRKRFADLRGSGLLKLVSDVYDFRNTYVAHQEQELKDLQATREALKKWVVLVTRLEGLFQTVI
jgi:type III restriction enzyme